MAPGPSVPFEIKYANASDLSTLVSIEIRSFPSSNYMRSTYKGCDQLAVHTFKTVSSLEYFAKSECHILAGVDPKAGDSIAYGRWNIPAIYKFERAVDTSLSNDAQAQMQNIWAYAPKLNKGTYTFYEEMIKRSRNIHLRETDIVLELLCVLPEYQRIGIGSAFLKWGIEKADASNARIYLEATMEGVPAYLKHGWKIVEEIQLDYTERGGEGSQKFALMIREPQEIGV
ncbi:GNAT family acetyltransferase [Penicillium cf. griseofulvum]|uniref:GNAT family acetyltransferase n=1 Tax=Penicillium cf. griseofulvum TaxID=2972120 RepID=A0A9W9T2E7_9EURO|nr:GNAT family acetyltransferase [Penicillium cf. griseofulvum]KAJ5446388.1 GNAT family acetyltransferase [Penicillium cf. griseofulvum]KAJ5448129.1 GNAT family acetyltransferase [Penicillium cf. griseofulvum]